MDKSYVHFFETVRSAKKRSHSDNFVFLAIFSRVIRRLTGVVRYVLSSFVLHERLLSTICQGNSGHWTHRPGVMAYILLSCRYSRTMPAYAYAGATVGMTGG